LSTDGGHTGAVNYVRKFLRERIAAFEDPNKNNPDDITQNGGWYKIRPSLIAAGIDPDHQGIHFRRNLTASIDEQCRKLGYEREQIGIFAGTTAFFFYRGEQIPVTFQNVDELMRKGTDIILIEKEGTPIVLKPYTDPAGIATITNKGFFVKYASKLARNADRYGANIAILTDFDISGIQMENDMHRIFNEIPRLGIDFKTLDYFGLSRDEVEEHINTEKPTKEGEKTSYNHFKGLTKQGYLRGKSNDEYIEIINYLQTKRIELDSVITHPKVGNKKFVEYIIDRLKQEFPTRNYNRVIDVPTYIAPDVLQDLNNIILTKTEDIIKHRRSDIINQLGQYEGIIDDVDFKKSEIVQELLNSVYSDTRLKPILEKLDDLLDELRDL
jgi:5S rRNA maturation endonuclease (ribonuclease M5)